MTSTNVNKIVRNFVQYVETIPLGSNPNREAIQNIINELKTISKLELNKPRLQQIKKQLEILSTYAKHPTTQKNIKIVMESINKVKSPSFLIPDILIIVNSFMPYDEILKKCRTDKEFAKVCNSPYLWYMLMQRDFPHVKVNKNDKNLRQQYQKQIECKNFRRNMYTLFKKMFKHGTDYNMILLVPVEAMEYLYGIKGTIMTMFKEYVDEHMIMRHSVDRNKGVEEYVTFGHLLLKDYHGKDKDILPVANETITKFNATQVDISNSINNTIYTLMKQKIPMYIVSDGKESLRMLECDILSASAYYNMLDSNLISDDGRLAERMIFNAYISLKNAYRDCIKSNYTTHIDG